MKAGNKAMVTSSTWRGWVCCSLLSLASLGPVPLPVHVPVPVLGAGRKGGRGVPEIQPLPQTQTGNPVWRQRYTRKDWGEPVRMPLSLRQSDLLTAVKDVLISLSESSDTSMEKSCSNSKFPLLCIAVTVISIFFKVILTVLQCLHLHF